MQEKIIQSREVTKSSNIVPPKLSDNSKSKQVTSNTATISKKRSIEDINTKNMQQDNQKKHVASSNKEGVGVGGVIGSNVNVSLGSEVNHQVDARSVQSNDLLGSAVKKPKPNDGGSASGTSDASNGATARKCSCE